jgi:cyclopropane fatty-acyl-phospholipid synthase-like methyltransferase
MPEENPSAKDSRPSSAADLPRSVEPNAAASVSEWYETFFTPLALEFWRAAVPAEATKREVEFLARELKVAPPARLLDLPCGQGRHALGLAARGYRVNGVDISPAAVDFANAAARGSTASFAIGDMRRAPPGPPYDAAYCFGNSFGYTTHEETKSFVRHVHEAVRPGGRWAIDTGAIAESLLPSLGADRELEAGGVTYCVRNRYDPIAGRLFQSCTLTRGADKQHAQISQAVYAVAELHRLLEAAGWRVVAAYGSLEGTRFVMGDRRLLVIAERPA